MKKIKLMTENECAEWLFPELNIKTALRKLYRLRSSGLISYRKSGRTITYTDEDINDYIVSIKKCRKDYLKESKPNKTNQNKKLLNQPQIETSDQIALKTFQ